MKFEFRLGSTLFTFIMSFLMIGFGIYLLIDNINYESFVGGLSSVCFMSPIFLWSGYMLLKMLKYRKTKIIEGETYKKVKRVFSDKDPYGEENWED